MHGCLSVPPGAGIQGHLRTPGQWDPRKERQPFPGKGFTQKGRALELRAFPQQPLGVTIVPRKAQDVCLWRFLPRPCSLHTSRRKSSGSRHAPPTLAAACALGGGRDLRGAVQKTRWLLDFRRDSSRKCRFRATSISFLEERVSPPAPRIWLKQSASLGVPGPWHSDVLVSAHLHTITGSPGPECSFGEEEALQWASSGTSDGVTPQRQAC